MKVVAYTKPGCPACKKQDLPQGTKEITLTKDIVTEKDLQKVPTIDVTCDNGKTKRFAGVTDKKKINSACSWI